jgi:hypothetical protein
MQAAAGGLRECHGEMSTLQRRLGTLGTVGVPSLPVGATRTFVPLQRCSTALPERGWGTRYKARSACAQPQTSVATNTAKMANGQTYRNSHTQATRATGVLSASSSRAKAVLTRHPTKMLVNKAPTGIMMLEHT